MRASLRWPLVVAISALVLGALVLFQAHGAGRVVAALWFLLACPGLAIVPLLPDAPRGGAAALVLAVSVAVDLAAATALLVAGLYSPLAAGVAVGLACAAGGCAQTLRWTRAQLDTNVRFHD